MSGGVRIEIQDRVLTAIFDRPEKKNAFTVEMYRALVEGLGAAASNAEVRVVLLRGEGGAFTSGNDIADFLGAPPTGPDHPIMQFLRAIAAFPKPLVAAVDGPAVGIGTTLLLHCDLVYASARAQLRLPFVPLGLVPEAASSLLLPRLVGPQRAAELLLLGEPFSAERGRDLGLVNEVLPDPASLYARAEDRAVALARLPPAAVREAKALLRQPTLGEVQDALLREGEVFMRRLSSPEAIEAMTAFMEKRAPSFDRFS